MESSGLIYALALDGRGGARDLATWNGVRGWSPEQGALFVHMDYAGEAARAWLRDESGIDPIIQDALLVDDPRPRSLQHGDGVLLIVRGINLNAGAEPEDMVSLRLWLDKHRIVSMRHRAISAMKAQQEALARGQGPTGPGDLAVRVYDDILRRIGRVVDSVDETVDTLEDQVIRDHRHELRHELAEVRRRAIGLRRFIGPQRAAMTELEGESVSWLTDVHRLRIRESAEHLQRMIEELDAARDRASVTQEELASRQSEMLDRRLYVLSLIAAVFLPLALVVELFGVGLGGMPGREWSFGFWALLIGVVGLCGFQLWLFRRLRWI